MLSFDLHHRPVPFIFVDSIPPCELVSRVVVIKPDEKCSSFCSASSISDFHSLSTPQPASSSSRRRLSRVKCDNEDDKQYLKIAGRRTRMSLWRTKLNFFLFFLSLFCCVCLQYLGLIFLNILFDSMNSSREEKIIKKSSPRVNSICFAFVTGIKRFRHSSLKVKFFTFLIENHRWWGKGGSWEGKQKYVWIVCVW